MDTDDALRTSYATVAAVVLALLVLTEQWAGLPGAVVALGAGAIVLRLT